MRELEQTQGELVTAIGGNGGGYAATDLNAAQTELAGLVDAAIACVERLEELGVDAQGPRPRPARLPVAPRRRRGACSAGTPARTSVGVLARARGRLRAAGNRSTGANRASCPLFWQRVLIAAGDDRRRLGSPRSSSTGASRAATSRRRPSRATACCAARSFAAIVFLGVLSALLVIPQVRAVAGGILASSAVLGLVIGFASQRTIGNVVAGILIAISQPLRLGDEVEVEGTRGVVEEIGLTYTWIRTRDNDRLVVPNEKLASETIRNSTIRGSESLAEASVSGARRRRPARGRALARGRRRRGVRDRPRGRQGDDRRSQAGLGRRAAERGRERPAARRSPSGWRAARSDAVAGAATTSTSSSPSAAARRSAPARIKRRRRAGVIAATIVIAVRRRRRDRRPRRGHRALGELRPEQRCARSRSARTRSSTPTTARCSGRSPPSETASR